MPISPDKHDEPTPRTDAAEVVYRAWLEYAKQYGNLPEAMEQAPAEADPFFISRQLERELAEANARSEELERDLYDERKYALRSASEPRHDTEAMRKLIADVNCEAVRVLWGATFERERWEAIRTRCVAFKITTPGENAERAAPQVPAQSQREAPSQEPHPEPADAAPLGFAVIMDDGNFVGAWKSREIAESICAKQPPSHHDRVVAICECAAELPSSEQRRFKTAAWNGKWCTYCRVDTHVDAECWSTRPTDWHPARYQPSDFGWLRRNTSSATQPRKE